MDQLAKRIFNIKTNQEFESLALDLFQYQAAEVPLYKKFLSHLKVDPKQIKSIHKIPFLPITLFKKHKIIANGCQEEKTFLSSGTTGMSQSQHLVADLSIYEQSFRNAFQHFYGAIEEYTILALLPSYLERNGSSLIYMVDDLIKRSQNPDSGFYLNNLTELATKLEQLDQSGRKVLLLGVSYALLDLIERKKFSLQHTIVMETGGMKGKRKEMVKSELHAILQQGFGVEEIHSEYGMTELLSQAYSFEKQIFNCPPWMRILIRDANDPFAWQPNGMGGGINIIDLANVYSCAFLATQDLGKVYSDNSFEVLGRFDHSDVRGCNLLVQ